MVINNINNKMTNYQQIQVNLNEEFNIIMNENPSTGYSWNVITDEHYIKYLGKTIISRPQYGIVGASNMIALRFYSVARIGSTIILLQYKRPWENKAVQEERIQVSIH